MHLITFYVLQVLAINRKKHAFDRLVYAVPCLERRIYVTFNKMHSLNDHIRYLIWTLRQQIFMQTSP